MSKELDIAVARAIGHLEPFVNRPVPCPDGKPGCCVLHFDVFDGACVRIPT